MNKLISLFHYRTYFKFVHHILNSKSFSWLLIGGLIFAAYSAQLKDVFTVGNHLSEKGNAYMEANALRAGESYLKQSFLRDAGLPHTTYGDRYPNEGHTAEGYPADLVDTNTAPGAHFMAAILITIFDAENILMMRFWPLAMGFFCFFCLVLSLRRLCGNLKAAILVLLITKAPMFNQMAHSLHYHAYSFNLLMLEIAILITYFQSRHRWRWLAILFVISFLQGWLSYEYFFIVALSPLPLACLCLQSTLRALIKSLSCILISVFGFALAHLLHFMQKVAYHDSFVFALKSFADAANFRQGDFGWDYRWSLLHNYLLTYGPSDTYFGRAFFPVLAAPLLLLIFRLIQVRLLMLPGYQITWKAPFFRSIFVFLSALLVSSLWIIVMPAQSSVLSHFMPRIYFVFYLCVWMWLLKYFKIDAPTEPA